MDCGVRPLTEKRNVGIILDWMGGYIYIAAFVLGAAHALQPGHGKTVVAAYLVGSHGTVRDALLLGIVVTITHTLIIYVLAVFAGWSALFWDLAEIEQILGAFAALLIVLVGLSLLWGLWRGRPRSVPGNGQDPAPAHGHAHENEDGLSDAVAEERSHADAHYHPDTTFAYGGAAGYDPRPDHPSGHAAGHLHLPGISHSHPRPEQMTSLSRIFLLGISGGIVPCPEGLAVFLASLAAERIETGVLLVAVFSLGLAATLMAVGILFLKAARLFGASARSGIWGNRISWISAAIITGVGISYFSRYLFLFLA